MSLKTLGCWITTIAVCVTEKPAPRNSDEDEGGEPRSQQEEKKGPRTLLRSFTGLNTSITRDTIVLALVSAVDIDSAGRETSPIRLTSDHLPLMPFVTITKKNIRRTTVHGDALDVQSSGDSAVAPIAGDKAKGKPDGRPRHIKEAHLNSIILKAVKACADVEIRAVTPSEKRSSAAKEPVGPNHPLVEQLTRTYVRRFLAANHEKWFPRQPSVEDLPMRSTESGDETTSTRGESANHEPTSDENDGPRHTRTASRIGDTTVGPNEAADGVSAEEQMLLDAARKSLELQRELQTHASREEIAAYVESEIDTQLSAFGVGLSAMRSVEGNDSAEVVKRLGSAAKQLLLAAGNSWAADERRHLADVAEAEEQEQSASSRRRLSPYHLRLQRVLTMFSRLFFADVLFGALIAIIGGVLLGQSLSVVAPPEGSELVVRYNLVYGLVALIPAFANSGTGILLALSSSRYSLQPRKFRLIIVVLQLLSPFLLLPCLAYGGIFLSEGTNGRDQMPITFYSQQARESAEAMCRFQSSLDCSGWDRVCSFASYQLVKGLPNQGAAADGSPHPTVYHYDNFCPRNCTNGNPTTYFCGPAYLDRVDSYYQEILVVLLIAPCLNLLHATLHAIIWHLFRSVTREDAILQRQREEQEQRRAELQERARQRLEEYTLGEPAPEE